MRGKVCVGKKEHKSDLQKVIALIPSAGLGRRIGYKTKKPFIKLDGRPILAHTIERLHAVKEIEEIIPILQETEMEYCLKEIVEKYGFTKIKRIAPGGKERQDSVYNGLKLLESHCEFVLIHDGVRPFITPELIIECLKYADREEGVVLGVPVRDTIKEADSKGIIKGTIRREGLWFIQTPQVFRFHILMDAYERAFRDGYYGTDDASLVERLGHRVKVIMGSPANIKITVKEDLLIGEAILRSQGYKPYGSP
ncbi:MAG: 2-C-methyl-D-erythritol 4-phosphate cytidylyltransferase [Nitrospirota bacterium]